MHSIKWPEAKERQTRLECARFGEKLPPDLVNVPQLHLGSALYLNAFFDLDFERDTSELQPIKRSACFDYARDYGFDVLQTEDLWYYIARMDKAYLKYRVDTAPKLKKPPAGGIGSRGRGRRR